MYDLRVCPNFTDLHAAGCSISPTPLAEETVFPHFIVLPPLSKINYLQVCSLFLGSLFCSIDPHVCLCQSHTALITVAF